MTASKAAIIEQLRKDILPLEGYKTALNNAVADMGLGPIKNAFPGKQFPIGAIHEFISRSPEDYASTNGFITGLLSVILKITGVAIWIGPCKTIFPPALKAFGIAPHKIIFIELKKENEILWALEEALKCEGLSAVIGIIPDMSFTASRRLQLAVEHSGVTGFILRNNPRNILAGSFVARWEVSAMPGEILNGMPGVGFPTWKVQLLKVRNGQPGSWVVSYAGGRFRHTPKLLSLPRQLQTKTG
jgi:protein ImuA